MFQGISYYPILGKPLIMYAGIATLLSFSLTAFIGYTNYHKKFNIIPWKYHPPMAALSLSLAILHGIIGVLLYL